MQKYYKRKPLTPPLGVAAYIEVRFLQQQLAEQVKEQGIQIEALKNSINAPADVRRAIYDQIDKKDKKRCQQTMNLN
jgi:hypothetical protein